MLSGPSGVGKDSVMNCLRQENLGLHFCVTATTRRQRPGEAHGVNHYFVARDEFERLREQGGLLEWALVHENYYGVPLMEVRKAFVRGADPFMRVDVQGAASVRARLPAAVLIFLAPESLDDLSPRLQERGTETQEEMDLRLANARREMEALPQFDYVVVNRSGRLPDSVAAVRAIVVAERSRVVPRWVIV
ncbi:MAG TPA: guanylate kinase [Chloroflexota bacterium]|nr:guanylate kinase [Chloroflexota bacterium]